GLPRASPGRRVGAAVGVDVEGAASAGLGCRGNGHGQQQRAQRDRESTEEGGSLRHHRTCLSTAREVQSVARSYEDATSLVKRQKSGPTGPVRRNCAEPVISGSERDLEPVEGEVA